MSLLEESDLLHARVRRYLAAAGAAEPFETLALALARFQARWIPGFARLLDARSGSLEELAKVPGVPTDAFRLTRVAVHPPELDEARFETSGTTGARAGVHALRSTATYAAISTWGARRALLPPGVARAVVVGLAPCPGPAGRSSLGWMMRRLVEELDGRALRVDATGAAFDADDPARWLAGGSGVDVAGLERAARVARERAEPLVVLATAFALVRLVDDLDGRRVELPRGSVVMETGGFKGRSREVDPVDLRSAVERALRLAPGHVIGEYGMTELTSQLWEAPPWCASDSPRLRRFRPVPTLRVDPVDPVTLAPVPEGELGIARITDLGNVDSAVVVLAQDQVRRVGDEVELLGRAPGAPARGCSLALESLLGGA
ncbi:MAG: acyl-protein synthetase [Polyangiaceae bacterium]|nr:acyl-protein synthetase [Polyangiaceae bacterium]